MSLIRMPHTVTVIEPTTSVDDYGAAVLAYAAPGARTRAWVQPAATTQDTTDDQTAGRVDTRLKAYLLAAVSTDARIVHDGVTYEVDGVVRWDDPQGRAHHYEAALRRVEG